MTKQDCTLANVTELARMFELSVNTVRARLRAAKVQPELKQGNSPLYKLNKAAQAIYGA